MGRSVLKQRPSKNLRLVSPETQALEESGFASARRVIQGKQVAGELPVRDNRVVDIGKSHGSRTQPFAQQPICVRVQRPTIYSPVRRHFRTGVLRPQSRW